MKGAESIMDIRKICLGSGLALVMAVPALADTPGTITLDVRARYENADQDGRLGSDATTLRTRLGWKSPDWNGVTILGELENNWVLDGDDDFNSGRNGLSQYTSISDAAFTELNRLQVEFAVNEHVSVVVGRQYVDLGDGRLVASAGWRQDKNSHDAVRVNFSRDGWAASYVYHDRINRGPGDVHWQSDSHLFHVRHALADGLNVEGFAYFIDITQPGRENLSNTSWGGRLFGSREVSGWDVGYEAVFTRQSDAGSASADFDLGLWSGEVSAERGGAEFSAGYVSMEGNGAFGFANPLGKNHGTLGWADAFSGGGRQGTADGLEDVYATAGYGVDWEQGWLRGLSAGVMYHDFQAERTGADLGDEWDAHVTARFAGGVSLSWQVAEYDGPGVAPAPADRSKNWIVLSFSR